MRVRYYLLFLTMLVISGTLFTFVGVQRITSAETSMQAQPGTVEVAWTSNGQEVKQAFDPGANPWLAATKNGTTTVFWAADIMGMGESFQFSADNSRWIVNGTIGDVNNDGIVSVIDIITLFMIIVGIL